MLEGIKKSMNYHHHQYSIWSQRYQYFQSFFVGMEGEEEEEGAITGRLTLVPSIARQIWWLCTIKTFKKPKILIFDDLNFLVGFHSLEFVFHGFLVGVDGSSILWVWKLYFKKKCIRNNKKCNEGGFRVNRITSFEKCAQNHSKWPAYSLQALPPSPLPGVARGRL